MVKSKDSQRYAKTEDVNVIFTISHFRCVYNLVISRQREGKVFSHVCHSVHKGERGAHCTWSQSLTPPTPTCSNLFNLVLTVQGLPQNIFKLDQYKAGKVGKLAVGILLECFLIIKKSRSPNQCTFFNKKPFKKLIKVLLTLILALQMNKTVTFK